MDLLGTILNLLLLCAVAAFFRVDKLVTSLVTEAFDMQKSFYESGQQDIELLKAQKMSESDLEIALRNPKFGKGKK